MQGSYAGAGAGSDRMVRSSEDRWSDPSAGAVAGQDGQGAELKVPESTLKGGTPTEAAEFEQAEGGRSGGIAGGTRLVWACVVSRPSMPDSNPHAQHLLSSARKR